MASAGGGANAPTLDDILPKIHDLSGIEIALLLCLVCHEHGILTTTSSSIDNLVHEISLAATNTFGLACVIINCTPRTTLDHLASSILVPSQQPQITNEPSSRSDYFTHRSSKNNDDSNNGFSRSSPAPASPLAPPPPPPPSIANCVIAKNLNTAPKLVQIQVLELLRTRRMFTRSSVQTAPKRFVFIPVLEADSPGSSSLRLTPHLVDRFALAHWHDPQEGFINAEEAGQDAEQAFANSTLPGKTKIEPDAVLVSENDVNHLAKLSLQVEVDIDVVRYQMNIVSFLRMHRAVKDGISPAATKYFGQLMRCLAPLHGLDYVTPALVGIAARKVYLHRIRITEPENERSMQWGSDIEAVAALLQDAGPAQVIEDVLGTVEVPT